MSSAFSKEAEITAASQNNSKFTSGNFSKWHSLLSWAFFFIVFAPKLFGKVKKGKEV